MRPLLTPAGRACLHRLLANAPLLAFDWDGTLVPLAAHASEARADAETVARVRAVAERWPMAIVSGRARADLRVLARGMGPVTLVGNHGMEGPARDPRRGRWERTVATWVRTLGPVTARLPGVWVEAKRLSLSVHLRAARDPARARRVARAAVSALSGARVVPGKSVLNVLPGDAPDKGSATLALARGLGARSVLFVGDDVTDEDAFRRAPAGGLVGVRVGRRAGSAARWFLPRQAAVARLLDLLAGG